ncbi:MAG: hypothetical protein FWG67_08695 [Defluviitaleaceae bacterium]|nr:hypothetical protein [Defluviitaleaceae bacterium]
MKKILKKVVLTLSAVVMMFAGVNLVEAHGPQRRWRVVMTGNTYVRTNPNGGNVGSIRQNANFVEFPLTFPQVVNNWTWIQGSVSGTAAQMNGVLSGTYWVATSQLTPDGNHGGTTCRISAAGTEVRHAPGGPALDHISTGATFRPWGSGRFRSGNWEWVLGTIGGTAGRNGHNGWGGRLMWVATSQLPAACRH